MSHENKAIPDVPVLQVVQQQSFSRSELATKQRAFDDLKSLTQKASSEILRIAATSPNCTREAFEMAWKKRQELNSLQQQLDSIEQKLNDCLPPKGSARLTDKERKEIQGLYSSGLYTQAQLAEQYGKTQSTISDIIKSLKS